MPGSERGVESGETGVWNSVKDSSTGHCTHGHLQIDVTRPVLAQRFGVVWLGLDVDPTPTTLVEGTRNRTFVRTSRSNVNVETLGYMLEGSPKHDIFKVLGVGNESHPPRSLKDRLYEP
jgi:hypothetical protein